MSLKKSRDKTHFHWGVYLKGKNHSFGLMLIKHSYFQLCYSHFAKDHNFLVIYVLYVIILSNNSSANTLFGMLSALIKDTCSQA